MRQTCMIFHMDWYIGVGIEIIVELSFFQNHWYREPCWGGMESLPQGKMSNNVHAILDVSLFFVLKS